MYQAPRVFYESLQRLTREKKNTLCLRRFYSSKRQTGNKAPPPPKPSWSFWPIMVSIFSGVWEYTLHREPGWKPRRVISYIQRQINVLTAGNSTAFTLKRWWADQVWKGPSMWKNVPMILKIFLASGKEVKILLIFFGQFKEFSREFWPHFFLHYAINLKPNLLPIPTSQVDASIFFVIFL